MTPLKRVLLASILVAGGYLLAQPGPLFHQNAPAVESSQSTAPASSNAILADAYAHRRNDVQVHGEGSVIRILPDDTQGAAHQRFLLRLDSGQTLLIAHNIALAPRIATLREGDRVAFYGEYEWNDKGGVIHWTHDDPQGRHVNGWLEHKGQRYE